MVNMESREMRTVTATVTGGNGGGRLFYTRLPLRVRSITSARRTNKIRRIVRDDCHRDHEPADFPYIGQRRNFCRAISDKYAPFANTGPV